MLSPAEISQVTESGVATTSGITGVGEPPPTVTVHVPVFVLSNTEVAVIVVVCPAVASGLMVTIPRLSTVATAVLEEVQLTAFEAKN